MGYKVHTVLNQIIKTGSMLNANFIKKNTFWDLFTFS